MSDVKHILRYGTNADRKYIEGNENFFDLLAINGNMLAYTPGALAEFIMRKFLKSAENKGFFIDPITHAFQHDIDKIKSYSNKEKKKTIKLSIEKLINSYGEPILSQILNEKSVTPKQFQSSNNIKSFCNNVIKFQLNTIREQLKDKGFMDYIPDEKEYATNLEPSFIISPYFYMTENTIDEWLPINISLINQSKKLFPDKKLFAQIVVSKDIFSSDCFLDTLSEKYSNTNVDGLLFWIDNFNEHDAPRRYLKNYIKFIKKIREKNISLMNLYGGFFSILLTGFPEELGFQLNGVGHGLEYGEYRSVIPVGGGIPTSRYYYYPLHNRLNYRDTSELLNYEGYFNLQPSEGATKYHKEICHCPLCKSIINHNINNFQKFESTEFYEVEIKGVRQRRSYANQETKMLCLIHYLWSKNKEFLEVNKRPLNEMINILQKNYDKQLEAEILSWESLAYLENWTKVLKEELEGEEGEW